MKVAMDYIHNSQEKSPALNESLVLTDFVLLQNFLPPLDSLLELL